MTQNEKVSRKTRRDRRTKPVIIIVGEGKCKTERAYFEAFNSQKSPYNITVFPMGDTDFPGMLKALKRIIREYGLNSKRGDLAFVIADLDNDSHKIEYLRSLSQEDCDRFIISNPCIEVWFINHFEYTTHQFNDGDEVVEYLKKHIPKYEKNIKRFTTSVEFVSSLNQHVKDAIENTNNQKKHHSETGVIWPNHNCNPYTDIDKIINKLI